MPPVNVTIDSYTILGVARDADIKEINAAYKRLALKFHPDKAGNGDAALTRFQKLQYAVELLRDNSRRAQLDRILDVKGKRRRPWYASGDRSTPAADADAGRSSKRGRRESQSDQRGWQPGNASHGHFPSDQQPEQSFEPDFEGAFEELPKRQRERRPNYFDFSSGNSRYMWSFGNSVHMNPESEESKISKAKYRAENVQWQQEWAGIDPEVEKARAEARKQAMRDRVARDAEAQPKNEKTEAKSQTSPMTPFDQAIYNAVNGLKCHPGVWVRPKEPVHDHRANLMDWDPPSAVDDDKCRNTMESMWQALKSSKSNDAKKEPNNLEAPSSPEPPASDVSTTSSLISSCSTRSQCGSTRSASVIASEPPTRSFPVDSGPDEQSPLSEPLDPPSPADELINTYLATYGSSLSPLIPLFKRKLADPLGRYTVNDLATELQGVVLESYTTWLEDMRVSISSDTPKTAQNNPGACSHRGGWYKEYGHGQCGTCNFWMPLFVLTCRGCGLGGCIRCKFTGNASVLKKD